MESRPQNPEFRINSENFHQCIGYKIDLLSIDNSISIQHWNNLKDEHFSQCVSCW